MSVRQTPISFLNAQVAEIPGLSTSVSSLNANFDNLSTFTVNTISTSVSQFVSSFTTLAADFSSLSTFISTAIGEGADGPAISTSISTINSLVAQNSTNINSLIVEALSASTSISTLTSSVIATFASAIGFNEFSTSFFLPVTGFSTVFGNNFSSINSTINSISTVNAQQTSSINTISTLAGQNTSSLNVQSTLSGEQGVTLSNVQISTQVVQFGARPLQAFNGPFTDADWGSGENSRGTSTIMRLQAGLTASGSGTVGSSNSVTLINNTTVSTTMFPLFINSEGQNIPTYPASANQILRFAHSGAPGSNSSIIINLTTGGDASDAIEVNAGEVITMVFNGGDSTVPTDYFYFPSL